jgi:G protein pathway suppressor 2
MKEEQERRKKKEMEERMSLEETKEQVSSLPALASSLDSPCLLFSSDSSLRF